MSRHHVKPKSRGGNIICDIPETFHQAWHVCFQNLEPGEVVVFIARLQGMMFRRNEITWEEINELLIDIREGE